MNCRRARQPRWSPPVFRRSHRASGTSPSKAKACPGGEWLGPTVEKTILELKAEGQQQGFSCSRLALFATMSRSLYDIDIAFRRFAEEQGMRLWRAESLNDSPEFVQAVATLAAERLRTCQPRRPRRPRRQAPTMMRIAIVGAGISGLSAALTLEKARAQGAAVDYCLFESAPRVGGSMFSERVDGCLVEAGPDSFLTEKPWAAMLCRELGIGDRLIGSNDHLRKTYIVVQQPTYRHARWLAVYGAD